MSYQSLIETEPLPWWILPLVLLILGGVLIFWILSVRSAFKRWLRRASKSRTYSSNAQSKTTPRKRSTSGHTTIIDASGASNSNISVQQGSARSRAYQPKPPPLNWPAPQGTAINHMSRIKLQDAYNELVLRLQPIGDQRLISKANELYEVFCALDPNVKRIQELYTFFNNQPGRVPGILDDFRSNPAVEEIWRDAWRKARNKSDA